MSLKYGSVDEPNEPQLTFCRLQAKVAEKGEAMRVATVEISILQVLLDTERQSCTSNANLEKELVFLQHSYSKLSDIARDLGFNAAGLLCTQSLDDPIHITGFGVLCRVMSDCLGHV